MKPTLCRIIFISLLAFPTFNLTATPRPPHPKQTIRGQVVDVQTQTPIPGVNVVILDSDPPVGTSTDENGYFELRDIPVGRVSLKFSYVGYNTEIIKNTKLQSGKELVLNIEMKEKVLEGEEVTITGDFDKDQPANKMAKVSARSFTIEETNKYAGSLNDVARMASNFAGVMSNDDSRNDIIIRGNSPTGLLWRLEGMDIPNPNHFGATGTTGGPVSMLNNNVLSNSDFMTGAFPAEYGNATAGVFDLKMRPGNRSKHEFLGQIGFNGFEIGAEGPFSENSNASFLANYRYSTLGVFDELGMDFGSSAIPYYQDLNFKVNIPSSPAGHISIFGLGGLSDIEIWDSRNDDASDENEMYGPSGYDITNSVDMGLAGITSTKIINEATYLKTTLGISRHDNMVKTDSISENGEQKYPSYRSNFTETKFYASSHLNKKLNQHHLFKTGIDFTRIGYNYKDSTYRAHRNEMEAITTSSGNTGLWQPWLQWEYRITDDIELTSGLHVSHFRLNKETMIEPRAGIEWNFRPGQSLSLGYGLHSQTAPLQTYFERVNQNENDYSVPNTDLSLTKSRHLVMSYDRYLGQKTRLKLESYYQHLFDVPVDKTGETPYSMLNEGANFWISTPDYLEASGTGWNYGIEMTLERFLHKGFYYLATGSLFESKYKDASGKVFDTAFNNNFVCNLLAGKEFQIGNPEGSKRKYLDINTRVTWAGGKRRTPMEPVLDEETEKYKKRLDYDNMFAIRLKDYFKTDLYCSFRIEGKNVTQEWGIEITNFFDHKNIFDEDFNENTGELEYTYQQGRLIIPQYRIIF
ncbi:MAG: TonB-dependent receptor [Marinilabilia sp.]